MRFVSTFAGVGGFDLGFEQAGWDCVGQVELDKNARAVLEKHWPEVPKHDDICTAIEWADRVGLVGNVDLVAGGFPCQPFSVAGKRLGRDDLRGNLFWNALEFAAHVEARHLVLENVPGILTVDSGRTFGEIVLSLGEAGFHHIEWRVLDSQWFGVPQRRRRVFIFASRDSGAFGGREVLVEREGLRWHPPKGAAQGQESPGTVAGGARAGGWAGAATGEGVAAPLLTNAQGGLRTTDIGGATFVVDAHPKVLWCRDVMGTLGTTFGSKNYSNVQEVSQGPLVVMSGGVVREDDQER